MATKIEIMAAKNKKMASIIDMCKQNPSTMNDIIDFLGMNRSAVENYVLELRRRNCLKSKRGQHVFYYATGKAFVPKETKVENKWRRRKEIMYFCTKNTPTQKELSAMHKVSVDVIKSDMQYLAEVGIIEDIQPSKQDRCKRYKTIQIKPMNISRASRKRDKKWDDMPDTIRKMFGVNDVAPKGGKTYRNMERKERSRPLIKVNMGWLGYSCEIA